MHSSSLNSLVSPSAKLGSHCAFGRVPGELNKLEEPDIAVDWCGDPPVRVTCAGEETRGCGCV